MFNNKKVPFISLSSVCFWSIFCLFCKHLAAEEKSLLLPSVASFRYRPPTIIGSTSCCYPNYCDSLQQAALDEAYVRVQTSGDDVRDE
jgi:hypothetical protein